MKKDVLKKTFEIRKHEKLKYTNATLSSNLISHNVLTKASNITLSEIRSMSHVYFLLPLQFRSVAMAEPANATPAPVRYSVWIGKKNAPLQSMDEIQNLLKANDFHGAETHARNWEMGGYIVS